MKPVHKAFHFNSCFVFISSCLIWSLFKFSLLPFIFFPSLKIISNLWCISFSRVSIFVSWFVCGHFHICWVSLDALFLSVLGCLLTLCCACSGKVICGISQGRDERARMLAKKVCVCSRWISGILPSSWLEFQGLSLCLPGLQEPVFRPSFSLDLHSGSRQCPSVLWGGRRGVSFVLVTCRYGFWGVLYKYSPLESQLSMKKVYHKILHFGALTAILSLRMDKSS